MSILVTGGAGYIGSHTSVELLNAGYDIVILDNFHNSKRECLERITQITGKPFTFYQLDVLDAEGLRKLFRKHDIEAVIHFAGLKSVGESVERPLMYYWNNVTGTITLCKAMEECGVEAIVFSSSATVYGAKHVSPLTEEMETGGCANPYGWTKYTVERILIDWQSSMRGSVSILRYFNPIGAHESGLIGEDPNGLPNNLMPYITRVALGKLPTLNIYGDDYNTPDGTGVRDYIHVVDLAKGHMNAIEMLKRKPRMLHVHNLGTGKGTSVRQLVNIFQEVNGVTIPCKIVARRPGDIAECYASAEKARQDMNFTAKYDIRRMCLDSYRWQYKNPDGF